MPSSWPAFVALATVVVLSLGVVVVDLVVDRATAVSTGELVDDALRSVALADDMRKDAHLLATSHDPARRNAAIAQLAFDLREYDPLATSPGEREEWERLRALLVALQHAPAAAVATDIADIEASIDRIVEINRRQASDAVATIQRTDTRGILVDAAGGIVTLALAAVVAMWLRRAIGRERRLLQAHLENLEDRRRELEAFAGRVAHDLRGPLTPLRGYADMLAEQAPQARSSVERIARATDRMSAIIDDLLALSVSGHPGTGETVIAPIVRDVLDELTVRLDGGNVALELDDSAARCSPSVLHQLLDNLVTNAIKYRSPARPLELAISCNRHDGVIDVAVADNGIGMDDETAAHVFEPFYRARDTGGVPGHGLGLAIVKRTVDALGGTCLLSSAVDRGTRVTIRLPAVAA